MEDELRLLRYCARSQVEDYDVLINYAYKRKFHDILKNYVDPELAKIFYDKAKKLNKIDEAIELAKSSPYEDYYLYFVARTMREKGIDANLEDLLDWLSQNHDFTYKMNPQKPTYIDSITKIYNSVIFLSIPSYSNIDNEINVMLDLVPDFFEVERIIEEACEHLVKGGFVYVYEDIPDFLYYKPEDIEYDKNLGTCDLYVKKSNPQKRNYRNKSWLI